MKLSMVILLFLFINFTFSQDIAQDSKYSSLSGNQETFQDLQSPAKNGFKSLILPGWGNPERASMYRGIEIGSGLCFGICFARLLTISVEDDGFITFGLFILSGYTLLANHTISSIDAMITTSHINNEVRKEYNISISPTYNPVNDQVGIGFAVNF